MRCAWTILMAGSVWVCGATASLSADAPHDTSSTRTADVGPDTQPASQYWFGVAVENIPPAFAKLMKLKPDQGLIIVAVMHDSPAERAGLMPDDLLLEINGSILTSQLDLARAANAAPNAPSGPPPASTLKYCREGDYLTATLQPVPRPNSMRVSGGNLGSFSLSTRKVALESAPHDLKPLNYVLPNGGAAQVGPGYHINLNSTDFAVKSIREVVSKGQTLILSQETDTAGIIHNSIAVGDKIYPVEPGQLDALPPDLRPLGEQLLAAPAREQPRATTMPESPEHKRIAELEQANHDMQKRLDDARSELKRMQPDGTRTGQ